MRWRTVSLTITAIILITLSSLVKSAHCQEEQWNKALIKQQALDSWYNQQARWFNSALLVFHQQVFLHKEFSKTELTSLWHPSKQGFHDKMDQQIVASSQASLLLDEQVEKLGQGQLQIEEMQSMWSAMSVHCDIADLKVNALSSARYVITNQELQQELTLLIRKVSFLKNTYSAEAQVLRDTKARAESVP
ncbi:hypothetical protein [Vibrio paucivorans]|uniref:Uncharacterized protein n=1 Tax=Vibrio paucivorans TaxID=2829489 RepID=A0A9X3CCX2_9VIBR|nr:hypothetical protein [Vibrio paucivorans]MCW8333426.1 hypothetical protein [Vibrio paucivorans]